MRLLTETLYASWHREQPFLAMADVGLFYARRKPALVPDVMLSLDVEAAEDWFQKENRSYFIWEFGKPPEVVIEIVSHFKGEELGAKMEKYAVAHVPYYVVYDPAQNYGEPPLRLFTHNAWEYVPMTTHIFAHVGLGLMLWEGVFEGRMDTWLRWCDADGNVIPTGRERAEAAETRAKAAEARAEALAAKEGSKIKWINFNNI
ncbi:MAG: Uma2 family endonuclease [Candidatus Kapaibacterium sp.]|nr:MAG: Uma2 family endonuclease [Candidatus Kapabacteria bacterium]